VVSGIEKNVKLTISNVNSFGSVRILE
jgi:hypothetical protein